MKIDIDIIKESMMEFLTVILSEDEARLDYINTVTMTMSEKQSNRERTFWQDNSIQFPRLLAEINANVAIAESDMIDLCLSMDLDRGDINTIFERAQQVWDDDIKPILQVGSEFE